MNVIFGIDRTLSGYKCQHLLPYTGLRSATLCFAIQPLWGKDKYIGGGDLVSSSISLPHLRGIALCPVDGTAKMTVGILDALHSGMAPITVDQYHQMILNGILHDGDPLELIEGMLVYKDRRDAAGEITTHGVRHLNTLNRLTAVLSRWVAARAVFLQVQGPIIVNDRSEPEPDCCLIAGTPDDFSDCVPSASATLVVFEVANSSLQTDRSMKWRLYAEASIPVYVIINLKENLIEIHSNPIPAESRYGNRVERTSDGTVEIPVGNIGLLTIVAQELL